MAELVWTVKGALDWTREYLEGKCDENPRLSAEWLLSAATGMSRIELYAFHDRPLSNEERALLRESVRRRGCGEPLQYVTGEMAFRHIVVKVSPGVLIPRPETEVLAGEVLDSIARTENPVVFDVCTGSGCIALSIAHEHSGATVWASDISPVAVRVATDNASRLGFEQRLSVVEGDLFEPFPVRLQGVVDVIVSNPPYIPSADVPSLPSEVAGYEPHLALDGGADGLDVYRRLLEGSRRWLRPGGMIAVELDERRVQDAAEEASEWYEQVRVVRDLAGRDRVVIGHLRA